ncbi:OB-fold domain-containing protein [Acidiferrimicrobium sp. IK]|uniref:thiolase C-terminal domain-containing protein n=1 Tax=Acidiferrimicrobium sp. IK TaxID=2871700 RepID=UPI0021CB2464|nr:OB-fold domain-containing protein [Acidiferrimicrobium sp. IK]MCU4186856.1 OB-fold domain-containing protein [Acidiferrimicrobium sp. IK]
MTDAPVRPLPQLTPWNEWWWTSGADGALRFARCPLCAKWVNPAQARCPFCHDGLPAPEPVAGTGTVVGFTVNVQQWLPEFPPPYVIAVVELDEDPTLRITTNVVGCPPEEVRIGQRVAVGFDHQEDVWVPVFHPVEGPDRPGLVDLPVVDAPTPIGTRPKFEDRVVVSGIGMSRVGRRLMVDPLGLTVDACLEAITDAGLTVADIDGVASYPGPMGHGMSEGGVSALVEALRLQPTWVNGGPETPGQIGSIISGMLAVASGLCRHVLCFRTVWEATYAQLGREGRLPPEPGRVSGTSQEFRFPFGATSAANWIAITASQYFHRFGGGRETLGWIALNARANAARNPAAIYRDPLTMDEYMDARMVSSPLGLYDCDVPCDGAVAVIVSAAETAGDLRVTPLKVEAVGTRITERLTWDQGTLTHLPQIFGPAAHIWTRTDLRPADVDVAQIYDGFTFNCLSWLEALGFCGIGESAEFLDGGKRIALDGELPLNTAGGQLSAGRLHGYGFVHEAVTQLRGAGGDRQVAGEPRVAMVAAGGGVPTGCFLLRTP